MLVIHWSKHNLTSRILKNGIRLSEWHGKNRGVYVYPMTPHSTLNRNWQHNLKVWNNRLGNYNGFVFRLTQKDFPVRASVWALLRSAPEKYIFHSLKELTAFYDYFFSMISEKQEDLPFYLWDDFEIIIPRRIPPCRIKKVIRDREPGKYRNCRKTENNF